MAKANCALPTGLIWFIAASLVGMGWYYLTTRNDDKEHFTLPLIEGFTPQGVHIASLIRRDFH